MRNIQTMGEDRSIVKKAMLENPIPPLATDILLGRSVFIHSGDQNAMFRSSKIPENYKQFEGDTRCACYQPADSLFGHSL
ncbi:MAG: hypothetical protein SRB2_02716 [Desulfobacteraceae bacterium Eth-SRB2]|nr:MAG: hypothetical protein SRB2_02716 [Desulfobacteraceae bacterium Eth-SRB2]